MRYDSDSGKINIALDEFISVARRGIAATVPFDEEEPGFRRAQKSVRRALLGRDEELTLFFGFSSLDYLFELTARIDGISENTLHLIYPVDRSPDKPRANELSEARARLFIAAYIYSETEGVENPRISLTFINEITGDVHTRVENPGKAALKRFFDKCVGAVARYAACEVHRVRIRLPSLVGLRFPFKNIREGQGELVRRTYRALKHGTSLYAAAPTGTGKTVSVLYPALRLLGEGVHDKIFYLTPKGTTADAAADCLMTFAEGGAKIRSIILTSKERSCKMGLICRKKSTLCKLIECNRIADATEALFNLHKTVIRISDIYPIADEFSVCPYELELAYAEICDVVICDVNYLFDPRAYIRRFFDTGGRYSFLIDEAHNLVERMREMYSAEISLSWFDEFAADEALSPISETVARLPEFKKRLYEIIYPVIKEDVRPDKNGVPIGATHLSSPPGELYGLFDELITLFDDELRASYRAKDELADTRTARLRDAYYTAKRFGDVLSTFDAGYKLFIFLNGENIRVQLFAIDTSKIIQRLLLRGTGAVFFSATFSPLDYYKSVLGGDSSSDMLEVSSPFVPEVLSVSIMDKISTRYSERERTAPAVVRAIAATISPRRGNYMVFLPSFEYLDLVADAFCMKYPKIEVKRQKRTMTAVEKSEFLDAFREDSKSYLVGFCVMGGIYSEGIDLVGDSLIGAVVVGIGMPTLSYEREAIAEYYEERFEAGRQYAYIYPGMNRVFQAAGRVIRREDDRGVIVLIDDRFEDPIYKKNIPSLWHGMEYVGDAKELNERVKAFWCELDGEK